MKIATSDIKTNSVDGALHDIETRINGMETLRIHGEMHITISHHDDGQGWRVTTDLIADETPARAE